MKLLLTRREVVVGVGRVLGDAVTRVVLGRVWREIDGVVVEDVEELLERLDDEDQRDEQREALLREARDVAHLHNTNISEMSSAKLSSVKRVM